MIYEQKFELVNRLIEGEVGENTDGGCWGFFNSSCKGATRSTPFSGIDVRCVACIYAKPIPPCIPVAMRSLQVNNETVVQFP